VRVIGLFSHDRTLYPLLSSALGSEFSFRPEPTQAGIERQLESEECPIALLDLRSTDGDLEEFVEFAHLLIDSGVTLIVLADDGQRMKASELVNRGAFGYCRRPPSIRELRLLLRRACEACSRSDPDEISDASPDPASVRHHMVGTSDTIQQVHRLIDRVADIDASVLIVGESGTGKELISRAIHNSGSRGNRPFVAVACGAIPETLIESELFGHEKGAFTGSVGTREGYLEQAGDGTLFLDEIGELSPYTQIKLLRVLQQREFSRLGGNRLMPLRARLVFATHRNLEDMVAEGKFRQDLFFRINVMKIEAPSLRDRAEDIPLIASHFLDLYARNFRKAKMSFAPEAMEMLKDYSWPGNVRELENVIQQTIIMSTGKVVQVEALPWKIREAVAGLPGDDEQFASGSFERQLRDYKIRLAVNAVRDNNGNKTLAARRLNISRAYLHRLIRLAEPGILPDVQEPPPDALRQYA
jgi:DNA-binding NtrC family response regulator